MYKLPLYTYIRIRGPICLGTGDPNCLLLLEVTEIVRNKTFKIVVYYAIAQRSNLRFVCWSLIRVGGFQPSLLYTTSIY